MCSDGATRSGLFAAAIYVIDMMKTEAVVDVFVACRFIAINRPQVINSQVSGSFESVMHLRHCQFDINYNALKQQTLVMQHTPIVHCTESSLHGMKVIIKTEKRLLFKLLFDYSVYVP